MHKKLKIWIFQTGEPLHIDGASARPMRAMNLSNVLVQAGHNVVLWSTDFYHQEKRHRYGDNCTVQVSDNLQIRLLHSRGYQRNIGIGRFIDHVQLAINFKRKLRSENDLPDIAFIGYPPIETAAVLSCWLKKNGIPSLLDVKDQWPSLFLDALPEAIQPISKIVLWPYFYLAKRTMHNVSGISSMAEGFLEWTLNFSGRKKSEFDGVFPLTPPVGQVSNDEFQAAGKWWDKLEIKEDERPRFYYVGSLSSAFDFKPVREAALAAGQAGEKMQFIICGEGDSSQEIKSIMAGLSNVVFSGWIDRPKIEVLAERCQASLAPYLNTSNFTVNIPNKVIDAMSLGLPILSPLKGEVASLISDHKIGMRYGIDTGRTLYECILALIQDTELQRTMSQNAKALYTNLFSFEKVYGSFVRHLEKMASSSHALNSKIGDEMPIIQ